MQKEKIVTTAITTEMDERFQAFCTANRTNKSAVVRKLISACLERHDFLEDKGGKHSGVVPSTFVLRDRGWRAIRLGLWSTVSR